MAQVRARKMGAQAALVDNSPEPWFAIRKQDTEWVDQATHVVALVNGPSHGVGMEIERALLKPERGLNLTPILALVRTDLMDKLTWIFWREVLRSGHVTDIYMTPRWQESTGARDEQETAAKLGIAIHYER